jgi:hypothetical protein
VAHHAHPKHARHLFVGYVKAADAEQAIRAAGISNLHEQARLAAQRVKEVG